MQIYLECVFTFMLHYVTFPKKRNVLTRLKQARDAVRSDNLRLRQKGGLVSHQKLLRDFEEKIDEVYT